MDRCPVSYVDRDHLIVNRTNNRQLEEMVCRPDGAETGVLCRPRNHAGSIQRNCRTAETGTARHDPPLRTRRVVSDNDG
jgi:hypothetical protein